MCLGFPSCLNGVKTQQSGDSNISKSIFAGNIWLSQIILILNSEKTWKTINGKTIVSHSPGDFSSVRISTIPAFGTIMETVTQKEVGNSKRETVPDIHTILIKDFTNLTTCLLLLASVYIQLLERVKMQLASFLEDPQYQDQHSLHMEIIRTFGRVGPNAEPRFRDDCVWKIHMPPHYLSLSIIS